MRASLITLLSRAALAMSATASFDAPVWAGAADVPASRPKQLFVAPAAGSYTLPPIQSTPNGDVLDIDGRAYPLKQFVTGKVTLLSFMYTYCVDPIACPLAFDAFAALRRRMQAQPGWAQRVRFVSLSFDPTNDTPSAMRAYGGNLADAGAAPRWHFLTTRSVRELKPLIDDFGQEVSVTLDDGGRPTRLFNHLLKVFLIDAAGRVREIYTTAYLMPDVLFNDMATLLLEQDQAGKRSAQPDPSAQASQSAPPAHPRQENRPGLASSERSRTREGNEHRQRRPPLEAAQAH